MIRHSQFLDLLIWLLIYNQTRKKLLFALSQKTLLDCYVSHSTCIYDEGFHVRKTPCLHPSSLKQRFSLMGLLREVLKKTSRRKQKCRIPHLSTFDPSAYLAVPKNKIKDAFFVTVLSRTQTAIHVSGNRCHLVSNVCKYSLYRSVSVRSYKKYIKYFYWARTSVRKNFQKVVLGVDVTGCFQFAGWWALQRQPVQGLRMWLCSQSTCPTLASSLPQQPEQASYLTSPTPHQYNEKRASLLGLAQDLKEHKLLTN